MHFNRLDVDMLHCWIHLEENAVIPVEDGDEEDGDDAIIEETLDPADKVELQRQRCKHFFISSTMLDPS